MKERFYKVPAQLGELIVGFTDKGISSLKFPSRRKTDGMPQLRGQELVSGREVQRQLETYFSGRKMRFSLTLDLSSGTAFERKIWRILGHIPYGSTRTYADVAAAAGDPKAMRAVGQACKSNPVPIIVPCHRVVASKGIGSYAAGLKWKKALLKLEGSRSR